jgi:IclR family transcriptional regulator, pca regulon regulatory protein
VLGSDQAPVGRYEVRSLVRGLRILESIERAREPLRLTDLANVLGVERATLFRYCATLVGLNYLHLDPKTKQYSLGLRARALAYAANAQWPALSLIREFLPDVAGRFRGAASLAVLEGDDVLYVERAVAGQALNQQIRIGDRLPALRTSIGKVLLAYGPEVVLQKMLKRTVDRGAQKALLEEIQQARVERMAFNIGGIQPGLNSVAVAIFEPGADIPFGGINLSGSATTLSRQLLRQEVGPLLLAFVDRISGGGDLGADRSG